MFKNLCNSFHNLINLEQLAPINKWGMEGRSEKFSALTKARKLVTGGGSIPTQVCLTSELILWPLHRSASKGSPPLWPSSAHVANGGYGWYKA